VSRRPTFAIIDGHDQKQQRFRLRLTTSHGGDPLTLFATMLSYRNVKASKT